MKKPTAAGYTLIELMVSIGLFAIVMVLVAGAYLDMINLSRQAQAISTAIDGVSYSIDTMVDDIRTGSAYGCGVLPYVDCADGGNTFSVLNQNNVRDVFTLQNAAIYDGSSPLTDPSITVSSLVFYVKGSKPVSQGDYAPPSVVIEISGSVSTGKGASVPFSVETMAVMRGVDL